MRTVQAQLFERVRSRVRVRPSMRDMRARTHAAAAGTPQNLHPPSSLSRVVLKSAAPVTPHSGRSCVCSRAQAACFAVASACKSRLPRTPSLACWACLRCWSLTAGREQLPPASWRPRRSKLREPSGWCVLLLPGSGERTHATLCARRGLHTSAQLAAHAVPRRTAPQIINAGQAKPSPPVGPALGQVCAPLPRLYSTHACGAPSIHPSINVCHRSSCYCCWQCCRVSRCMTPNAGVLPQLTSSYTVACRRLD